MTTVKTRKAYTDSFSLITTIPKTVRDAMNITENQLLTWNPLSDTVAIVTKHSNMTVDPDMKNSEFIQKDQKETIETVVALHNFLLRNAKPEVKAEYVTLKKLLLMED